MDGSVVSIHAPRAGRDCAPSHRSTDPRVSIHAPRAGRDLAPATAVTRLTLFQSTRPARGATFGHGLVVRRPAVFQSTRPARGATSSSASLSAQNRFQSTRPARGATGQRALHDVPLVVSIHAPRAGRDVTGTAIRCPCGRFNPRAPRGARRRHPRRPCQTTRFQSTRPARGATSARDLARPVRRVSIHAPRAGRDITPTSGWFAFTLFQSTRPARGATRAPHD